MASRHRWVSRVVRLTDEERLESQYLRRTLATAVGVPEFWDWRTRPTFDAVARLVADFGTWITSVAGLVPVPNARGFAIDFTRSATRGNALGYDAVAGDYRRTWRRHLQYDAVGRFVSRLPARRTTGTSPRVLDLACGPGMYVKAFHHLGLRCVGTDISSGMLLEARRELAAELREAEPPLLLRMDNAAPALAKGAFDGVWFSAGLVHTPRPVAASTLANVRELLVDGGVLYLSAQVGAGLTVRHEGRVFVYYTEPELLALFRDAGFDVLERWDGITERGSVGDNRRKTWQHYLLAPVRRPAAPTGARPNPRSLAAVGERGLVAHLKSRLPQAHGRLVLAAGDDAAALAVPHGSLVVATVDPCPQPVLSLIEGPDRWVDGWYAMAISLSDLAAMGATPSGALLAVEMPPDSMMADLDRFYDGALAAAEAFDCPVIGGNVKDAERFSCVSVGLGYAAPDRLLRRDSAAPGDAVLVLGTMGLFWAAVFQSLQAVQLDRPDKERLRRAMRQPVPRLREGRVLADKGFSRCAIDSSDGVTACLHEIAVASGVDLHLDFTGVPVDPVVARVAEAVGIDVRKLLLAWGDWQLVCTVAPDIVGEVREAMARLGCPTHEVGWVGPGGGAVWVHESERTAPLNYVASERFSPRSYFTHGIEKYAAILREEPLTLSTEGGRGA
jgi:thiamine-monophosphate kinase